jgi:hypothetical protein
VRIDGGTNNTIGGTAPGAGNFIAFNFLGVQMDPAFGGSPLATGNAIRGNSIFSHTPGIGIDLTGLNFSGEGVSPNDSCDGDVGANNLQNFPVLTSASSSTSSTAIAGTLDSNAGGTFTVEFFANPACAPSGNGEGKTFIGSTVITTDQSCSAAINFTAPVGNLAAQVITATATDSNNNTSEFSACLQATAAPTPSATPTQALNISTRLRVDIGDKVMIGGFIIRGNASKPVVVRGLGPSLANAGIPAASVLNNPFLELRGPNGALITSNDNWKDSPQKSQIEGTFFEPADDREAVILATLSPGIYTAILSGVGQTTGVGLVEIYDNNQALDSDLANISTRGFVQTGNEVMIGGFTLGGNNTPTRMAVRALGPSLSSFGLSNVLADPTLELHNANGTIMVSNDNWQDDPASASQLTANGLALSNPLESGIFTALAPPGQFTAILAGKNGGVGIGLVEIYSLR